MRTASPPSRAREILDLAPVVPVVVIDDPEQAPDLARALSGGGLGVVEVTLRTPGALAAVEAIRNAVDDIVVGVGTVLTSDHVRRASDAGAQFLVSPGCTPRLLDDLVRSGLPFLPGVATASDLVQLVEHGLDSAKFFPAEASGGIAAIRALSGPFPSVRLCPTGGITPESAPRYLAEPQVGCVGASWVASPELLRAGGFEEIARRARAAARWSQGSSAGSGR